MPIPANFDNTVRVVTGSPVGATEINAELTTQNGAGYWLTSLVFVDANTALLLFVKTDVIVGYGSPQKVNLVAANQAAMDADKVAETPGGYWPTGFYVTPGGDALVQYQQLDQSSL